MIISDSLPTLYNNDINILADRFDNLIPDDVRNTKSYHLWTDEVEDKELQNSINNIRNYFLNQFRQTCKHQCFIRSINAMDELYYSFPPTQTGENVYGDAGLFNHHIDGMFIYMPNASIYRVIVGLTQNDSVYTVFPDEKKVTCLKKGDYIGFDFNRDVHFVAGSVSKNDRLLLKLHFVKCEPCGENKVMDNYVQLLSDAHKEFEHRSRSFMSYGAKPETYLQYTAGYMTVILTWVRVNLVYISFFMMIIIISIIICLN